MGDRKCAVMTKRELFGKGASGKHPGTFRYTVRKITRNEPCPCGSGKKVKKCCGVSVAQTTLKIKAERGE